MTDQTGAEQQGAAGSRTGDVDVADESVRTSPRTCRAVERPTSTRAGRTPAPLRTTPPSVVVRMPTRRAASAASPTSSVTTPTPPTTPRTDGTATFARGAEATTRNAEAPRRTCAGPRRGGQAFDEERQKTAEEFAREHDPEKHDVAAGEEFRQGGDWTADDAGGPQVWDSEGHLVSRGSTPGDRPSQAIPVKPWPVRIGPVGASGRPGRRRTAHVLAGRDPRRWLRGRLRRRRSTTGPSR